LADFIKNINKLKQAGIIVWTRFNVFSIFAT
jgi:hypothetical protein